MNPGIDVEPDVAELRFEIGVGRVGMTGSGFDSLLGPLHPVAAREVAELELLRLAENLAPQPRRSLGSHRDLVHVEIDEIAALVVRALQRLLDVEQEPGEVLAQAHSAADRGKAVASG